MGNPTDYSVAYDLYKAHAEFEIRPTNISQRSITAALKNQTKATNNNKQQ